MLADVGKKKMYKSFVKNGDALKGQEFSFTTDDFY